MGELSGTALVTGASQGIGLAIATALVDAGMEVWMASRRPDVLATAAQDLGPAAHPVPCDVTSADDRDRLVRSIRDAGAGLDVLVLNAGLFRRGLLKERDSSTLGAVLETNVMAAHSLAQACLPLLVERGGQIVFMNSSAGRSLAAGAAHYSVAQHAARAMAGALRTEVNPLGVRVTVVFPGRTATPLQASIHELEGIPYRPELLVQPSDIAEIVLAALRTPRTAEVTDIAIRPMQPPSGRADVDPFR